MTIDIVNPEIIGTENYIPTENENLFVNPDDNTTVVVGYYSAYRITTTE